MYVKDIIQKFNKNRNNTLNEFAKRLTGIKDDLVLEVLHIGNCIETKYDYEGRLKKIREAITELIKLSKKSEEYRMHLSLMISLLYFCCGKMPNEEKDLENCEQYDDKRAWEIIDSKLASMRIAQKELLILVNKEEEEEEEKKKRNWY